MDSKKTTSRNRDNYEELLRGLLTKEDVMAFHDQIESLENSLFYPESTSHSMAAETKEPFVKALETQLPYEKKERLIAFVQKSDIDPESMTAIRSLFAEIKEYLLKIPVISLSLAFDPDEASLKKIVQAINDYTPEFTVVDLNINKQLLGGALIEWDGNYRDYTVKKRLHEYFMGGQKDGV